jgi:hypothetical protein
MIQNQTAMFAEEITRGESLEQQRDKAREQANHMREKWLAKGQCCEHLGAELHEARRERDEARKDAATWKSLFSAMERAGAEQSRRADENKLTTAAVTEQRDEARADAEKAKAEMVERYIVSIQQEHDRWNAFREYAMDRQQFILVARYGDVCDALKMAMDQARKILLPNADGDGRSEPAPSRQ